MKYMFDKSNEIAVLKTSIKMLEQRKQRLVASLAVQGDTKDSRYWLEFDLKRIESLLQEANLELARKTDAQ
jgi:hypothetical protein